MMKEKKIRIAVLDRDLCTREKCGYQCIKVCPVNRMGGECIVKDSEGYPIISEELCIGCGICVKKCPVNAIKIINLGKDLGRPIFQYGVNSFRLYGIPLPQKDGAVSLLGKNGIGKTTALKLLAGILFPNLGYVSEEKNREEILRELPIEIRTYFQSIEKEKTISFKIQNIDKIRRAFKGNVRELIREVTGKKDVDEIAATFGLQKILDRDIKNLSGGELQKVAIACTYFKEADLYYFDEPTNYLDIGERLNMALKLRELTEKKPVVVVEHDLTVLDYVSSYVYIFFGEENAYGAVSHVRHVRSGVNEYIQGYLRDENIRFRDYEFRFLAHSEGEVKTESYFSYPSLRKSFPGFSFSSEEGEIRKGEVLGIVGRNALGKTLFIKMLAGVEKPDEGNIETNLKLSYKPQYISPQDIVVRELFSKEKLISDVFSECKRLLKINALMEKNLKELSGGELQRIAITLALSRDADLYLFDEPSAFLDVEQRFAFAHLLRSTISERDKAAFVVDHDIIFIDAISNRILTFEGEPSIKGHANTPMDKKKGMNMFLKIVGITMRRDKDTKRPRINKPGSALDREQKEEGEYYY